MTPIEFKAWFDGFSEGIDKQPTQKQWARIKERVAEIDGAAITEKIFLDRYHHPYYYSGPTWVSPYIYMGSNTCSSAVSSTTGCTAFNGLAAMNALGKSEIAELNGG
jgi:hypothetical protein